jgi:hypothetical protein
MLLAELRKALSSAYLFKLRERYKERIIGVRARSPSIRAAYATTA